MRIAVATEDGKMISSHFGRSPLFAIYDISEGSFSCVEMRKNTFTDHFRGGHEAGGHTHEAGSHHRHGEGHGDGHRGIAEGLGDCGVVISRGMGRRAVEDLKQAGADVYVTAEREVETAVRAWIDRTITTEERRIHG